MSQTPLLHYQDEHLLVLEKPAGLLCVPGKGADKQDCLSARAQNTWPDALIVHRLDMATSGIVIMARHLAGQRALSHAFAQRQVHKQYEAIVWGAPEPCTASASDALSQPEPSPQGWSVIDLPIAADWERRPLRVVCHKTGKPSQTLWQTIALHHTHSSIATQHGCGFTRIALQPITGRTHQLRVHMQAIGHPIAGDNLYAPEKPALPRMLLHACQLALAHPVTGQWMQWSSPAPF